MKDDGRRQGTWFNAFVVVVVAVLLASACSSDGGEASPTSGESEAAQGEGGVDDSSGAVADVPADDEAYDLSGSVVMAVSVPPGTLDPHKSQSVADLIYMAMVYDRLMELSNTLEVVPMLATEWAYTDDNSAFEVTLRQDAMFHDGTPFNAAAVVANIERAKSTEGSAAAHSLSQVSSVEEIDEFSVRFNLDGAPNNLPELLAGLAGTMISPAAIADGSLDQEVPAIAAGTGPYVVGEWLPGQSATFAKADGYWAPERQRAGEVRIEFQPDDQARFTGMSDGSYDVAAINGEFINEAVAQGNQGQFRYLSQSQNSVYGMFLNPTSGDLANTNVRQAVMMAVNRNYIVDAVLGGACENRAQTFPLGSKYFFPELEQRYPFDPEEARRLISESGIDAPSFTVQAPAGIYTTIAKDVQTQLAEVGITMNIAESDLRSVSVAWLTGQAEAAYLAMPAYSDPGQLLDLVYVRVSPWLLPGSDIPARASAALSLGLDEEAKIEAYHELLVEINELAIFAPACTVTTLWAWGPDIVGVDTMPNLWQGVVAPYTVGRALR